MSPTTLSRILGSLVQCGSRYYCLAEEETAGKLAEGWSAVLIAHLTGGRKRLAICPSTKPHVYQSEMIAQSTLLRNSVNGCVVLERGAMEKLATFAQSQEAPLSLSQLIFQYARKNGLLVLEAADVGIETQVNERVWSTPPSDFYSPNQFETKQPSFPLIKLQYRADSERDQDSPFGIGPKELFNVLRYLNDEFLLVPGFHPVRQINPSDRRARINIEFICAEDEFNYHIAPLLEVAGIHRESVTAHSLAKEKCQKFDSIIAATAKPLAELQKALVAALQQNARNKPYQAPEQKYSASVVLVCFENEDTSNQQLEQAVLTLRAQKPGIDITLIANDLESKRDLIQQYNLRPFVHPIRWIQEQCSEAQTRGEALTTFFFEMAKTWTLLGQFRLPTIYPANVPRYIASTAWWLSRGDQIILMNGPQSSPSAAPETSLFAALVATLGRGRTTHLGPSTQIVCSHPYHKVWEQLSARIPLQENSNLGAVPAREHSASSPASAELDIHTPDSLTRSRPNHGSLVYLENEFNHGVIQPEDDYPWMLQTHERNQRILMQRAQQHAQTILKYNQWPAFYKGVSLDVDESEELVAKLFEIERCHHVCEAIAPTNITLAKLSDFKTKIWRSLSEFHGITCSVSQ